MSDAIVCEGLTKSYGLNKVVNNLTLRVAENSVFGFLGPNGAGKSTTIKLLTSQIKPTAGKAWVAGEPLDHGSPQSRKFIGYLSELPNYYGWMTGMELLAWTGELFGLNPAERRARAKELLILTGIEEAGNRKVATYSGGMRQRLGIAQALVNHPRVIFLDEPVSALDPVGRRDVLTLLDGLRKEATVFMSSHVLADVDRVCDAVAILHKGNLMVAGNTAEIKEQYARPALWVTLEGGYEPANRLAECLIKIPEVKQALPDQYGRLFVELINEQAVNRAGNFIPKMVAELDLTIAGYQEAIPNLEDVFIKVVGDSGALNKNV
jgi:ABC-2 type transport system ATP-binding protein